MEVGSVNRVAVAAEQLKSDVLKKEPQNRTEEITTKSDFVEIERENVIASGILPETLKEAAEAIREIKLQILENPTEAFNVQANLNTPNIVNLL
jgi:hypothetical protein